MCFYYTRNTRVSFYNLPVAAKRNYTITLDEEALERLRDAAYWPEGETLTSLLTRGGLELVARLEAERGSPFPPREGDLRTGRPKTRTS